MNSNGFDSSMMGQILMDQWDYFNWYYLEKQLKSPSFQLFSGKSNFGFWNGSDRIIGISMDHIQSHPWTRVMDTLKHEMAHQFVDEVLLSRNNTPHDTAFHYACSRLKVPAHAGESWYLDPTEASNQEKNPVIQKISKLLSLAQSPNENEAQLAMKKARELLMKHQVDEHSLHPENRTYKILEIGSAKKRFDRWEKKLISILQEFFFVKILWQSGLIKDIQSMGHIPVAHGQPENLSMAAYVHDYFQSLLPQLWKDFKSRNNLTSDKPRKEFYFGVLCGFAEKLREQNAHLAQFKALVWKGDKHLEAFFKQLHPHTSNRSSGRPIVVGEAFDQGKATGKKVILNRPIENRPGQSGRYLNP